MIDPVTRAVRLIDRKKDVVNVGGFNVYPGEVEAYLRRHPHGRHGGGGGDAR